MAIHILVPQERLAELLKKEVFADFASGTTSEHSATLIQGVAAATELLRAAFNVGPDYENACKLERIEEALDAGELAKHLGYQYTVDTDANYFASLEDMLDAEE